jgi:hypothetical protein
MSIKLELVLRSSEKAKDKGKDPRGVTSVLLRGEREFAVMAVGPFLFFLFIEDDMMTFRQSQQIFIYGVLYPFSASAWVDKVTNALSTEVPSESRT